MIGFALSAIVVILLIVHTIVAPPFIQANAQKLTGVHYEVISKTPSYLGLKDVITGNKLTLKTCDFKQSHIKVGQIITLTLSSSQEGLLTTNAWSPCHYLEFHVLFR